ncbi:MAG: hypothetical protein IJP64_05730 [Oscillospiraceae bacterium]|nr:hypothetical protein [Oscillospiraceae bacterium]
MPETRKPSARLRALYENYLAEVETAARNLRPGAGWFGTKGGLSDDPCHERFAAALRSYLEELTSSGASSAAVRDEMAYVYTAPLTFREPRAAYWMLIAVQGLTQPLIASLTPQDAAALAELMEKSFRRSERMPVQIKLIKELKAASKA